MSTEEKTTQPIVVPNGLKVLTKGYMDYVKYVIYDRAIVNIDGLKPSQRRILTTMQEIEKAKNLTKCAAIVGSVLKLHPHGDSAVYGTLCRMIDSSGFWNVPVIKGKGSFQRTYTTAPSSASRYTECCLREEANLYFDDIAGVNRIPNFDNSRTEPELLPVKFPSVLCNASSGIAVGIASNIPSFNFNEVLDATIEIIETGTLKKPIAPDFSGGAFGGEYVWNENELWKMMHNGRGSMRLRGKWTIDKKTITITEIPYYTTEEAIKKIADELPDVRSCTSLSDINGMEIQVECNSVQVVDSVLEQLIHNSDLQMNVNANIVVILGTAAPKMIGVIDLIKEWVKFRKGVLLKMFTQDKERLEYEVQKYSAFLKVLTDEDIKVRLIKAMSGMSEDNAEGVLAEILPDVDRSIYTWIMDRKIRSLASPHRAQSSLSAAEAELKRVTDSLNDLDKYIVEELRALGKRYKFPRKTEITDVDYQAVDKREEVYDARVTIRDKFVSKYRDNGAALGVPCKSDDIFICMDNQGRILKIPLKDIPETSTKSLGTYIPTFLKIKDDFQIIHSALCEDKSEVFLHKDGCLSVIDYSEWKDSKRGKRVIMNGFAEPDFIFSHFDDTKPYCFIMTDFNRVIIADTEFIRKSRTARTRYIKLKPGENIDTYIPLDTNDLPLISPVFTQYIGKMCKWNESDFDVKLLKKMEKDAKASLYIRGTKR